MAPADFTPEELNDLAESLGDARESLEWMRCKRKECIEQFTGEHYGPDKTRKRVPLPLMQGGGGIYRRYLAPKLPKVLVSVKSGQLRPDARNLQDALDHLTGEIELEETFARWVTDALFGVGIMHVGVCSYGDTIEIDGFTHDVTQPFADVIDFDDFIFDAGARRWDKCQYMGHRYDVDLKWAKKNERFDAEARRNLDSERLTPDETAAQLSRGQRQPKQFQKTVELWDIWLPQFGAIVTIADNDIRNRSISRPLEIREWAGPEKGPYRLLAFEEVPGQILPLPPSMVLLDLHHIANGIERKLNNQTDRAKEQTLVKRGFERDAVAQASGNDGDVIPVDDVGSTGKVRHGGPDNNLLAMRINITSEFEKYGGNLGALGGLGAQSETAKQDQLISESANGRVKEMQQRVFKACKGVYQDLAFWLYYDPLIEIPLTSCVPGTSIAVSQQYGPEDREGDFLEYNFEINPYSSAFQTPQTKLGNLQALIANLAMPLMPFGQQQGTVLNFENTMRMGRRWGGLEDEVEELFVFQDPSDADERGPIGENPRVGGAMKPSTRTYERVSRSAGGTPEAKNQQMMQRLIGAGSQPSQGAVTA